MVCFRLFVGLFLWILGLVNWGLLSVFIVSVFSVSCILGFGVGFCLSLNVFFLIWRGVDRSGRWYWGSFDF